MAEVANLAREGLEARVEPSLLTLKAGRSRPIKCILTIITCQFRVEEGREEQAL